MATLVHGSPVLLAQVMYAGTEDLGAGQEGQARGQGAKHPSGSVCPRRDRAHSRRQTRRTVYKASHRYRFVKGPSRWRQVEPAEEGPGLCRDSKERAARRSRRPEWPHAFRQAVSRGPARAQGRTPTGGVSRRAVETSQDSSRSTTPTRTERVTAAIPSDLLAESDPWAAAVGMDLASARAAAEVAASARAWAAVAPASWSTANARSAPCPGVSLQVDSP